MGYWDKKEEERVEEAEKPEITLEEYEQSAKEKLDEDGTYLSRKMQEHKSQFAHITSDGFWFAVYFNNDTQKEEFLDALGFDRTLKFVKGSEMVRAYRKSLKTPDIPFNKEKNPVKEYQERARSIYTVREEEE